MWIRCTTSMQSGPFRRWQDKVHTKAPTSNYAVSSLVRCIVKESSWRTHACLRMSLLVVGAILNRHSTGMTACFDPVDALKHQVLLRWSQQNIIPPWLSRDLAWSQEMDGTNVSCVPYWKVPRRILVVYALVRHSAAHVDQTTFHLFFLRSLRSSLWSARQSELALESAFFRVCATGTTDIDRQRPNSLLVRL